MKRKLLIIALTFALVMVLAVTGVYATDLSGFFSSKNWGTNPSSTLTFFENGFTITPNGTSYNLGVGPSSNITSMSGSVEVTLEKAGNSNWDIFFSGNSYIVDLSITNPVGCTVSENGRQVYPVNGSTYCSFDFSVTYSTATTFPHFDSNNSSVGSPTVAHFLFNSLSINGNDIIGGTIGETMDFSIPAGYAVVISGPCEIVEQSYYINNSYNFAKNGNMRVNGARVRTLADSYIVDGFSPDRVTTFDDLIQWEALNPNIFGDASNYEAYDSNLVTLAYDTDNFVISYPTLFGYGNENSRIVQTNGADMVCSLYVNYQTRPSIRWVAIESLSQFSNTGEFSTYSVFRPAVADVEGTPTEGSGGVVVNPETTLPSNGGNHSQPPVNEDNSLLGILSRLTNTITGLFRSAVDAIETLVNEGSAFMHNLSAIFTWLPQPVFAVLVSALTILVVIGVLKLLF